MAFAFFWQLYAVPDRPPGTGPYGTGHIAVDLLAKDRDFSVGDEVQIADTPAGPFELRQRAGGYAPHTYPRSQRLICMSSELLHRAPEWVLIAKRRDRKVNFFPFYSPQPTG